MKRKFSRTENVLLIVLVVILLALFYYRFVIVTVQDARVNYDTSAIDAEITQYQAILAQQEAMQKAIDEGKSESPGYVATYNSLKQEISELNDIFADAETFSFNFASPVADGDAVRRVITVSFTADSYEKAKEILQNLYSGKYRCLINSVSVNSEDVNPYVQTGAENYIPTLDKGPVSANVTVTFYETTYGAKSTEGLEVENTQQEAEYNDVLTELANEKEEYENAGQGY